jgi:hypothetical protein
LRLILTLQCADFHVDIGGIGFDNSGGRDGTFKELIMLQLHSGQCGLCSHFGEEHSKDSKLVEIRTSRKAPEAFVDDCAHPRHASLHLKVTPASGCDGFEPVRAN